jgi:hypothetical protein
MFHVRRLQAESVPEADILPQKHCKEMEQP